jgi:hypothetical protein
MMRRSCIVAMQYIDTASQQNGVDCDLESWPRRIEVKKTTLSIAAAVMISIAGGTAGLAAELPTYESAGLPISAMQVQVLGAANVREQSPLATTTATAHQWGVLTPRTKLAAATVAPARTSGLSTR